LLFNRESASGAALAADVAARVEALAAADGQAAEGRPQQQQQQEEEAAAGAVVGMDTERRKVLLHSCCAPCSGAMVEAMVATGCADGHFHLSGSARSTSWLGEAGSESR
jgi:hypothetical protein